MRSPAARWVRYPPLADGAPGCRTQPASLKHMSARLPGECLRLLDFQRGVIARWQAAAVGLEPTTIDAMLRRYRWQSLYREVYATFTGDPPRECVPWAAVLRAGDGAVLSRHTAAELDGLADKPSESFTSRSAMTSAPGLPATGRPPARRVWCCTAATDSRPSGTRPGLPRVLVQWKRCWT